MKARTRILAMLLTVLMVGGILPLSLFAVEGTGSSLSDAMQVKTADRTLEEIKEEFGKENLNLTFYQSFENWAFSGTDTRYYLPTGTGFQPIVANAEYNAGGKLEAKNGKVNADKTGAFSITTEADGNVALYLGTAAKYDHDGKDGVDNYDNFVEVSTGLPDSYKDQQGNGTYDFFVSADFKMGGANITQNLGDNGLFGLVYRVNSGGASVLPTVTVSDVGGLYIGGEPNPDKLIGFLSDKEYTRVAISISRASNKLFVYINDVLVNPEGSELIPEDVIANMNLKNEKNDVIYTAQNFPLCTIRMYNVNDNVDKNQHKGLFFDNFLVGTRLAVNPSSNAAKDVFTSRFAASLEGQNVGSTISGTTTNASGIIWPGSVKYFKESDGSIAMQWHKTAKDDTTESDQAYFNINSNASKGANLRFSIDLKLGADGCLGGTSDVEGFIFFRSEREGMTRQQNIVVKLNSNGNMTSDGKALGTLTKTEYSNLTIDVVCNGVTRNVVALMFFNGKLVYTKTVEFNYAGSGDYSITDYHLNQIRVYPLYNGQVANLRENDLCMKSVSLNVIPDYDDASEISIFAQKQTGFVENAGVTRYYDKDGNQQTEDFEYGGEKYLVGYAGNIIGKESDGIEVTPYAPYEDWEHTAAFLKTSPEGDIFKNGDGGSANVNPNRDAFQTGAKIPETGDAVRLYTSYYDYSGYVNDQKDHNSYIQWASIDDTKRTNASLVLDMDIMMAEFNRKEDISQAVNTFFCIVGNTSTDGNGSRKDTNFLKMTCDGWVTHEGVKLFKISQTEFTRISVVFNILYGGATNMSMDVYANGVKVLENVPAHQEAKYLKEIRFFSFYNQDISMYVKDLVLYEGEKPEQFVTITDGEPTLTNDADANPAKASDIKKGFITENSVVRYYGENGLPAVAPSGIIDFTDTNGRSYKADKNGVVYIVTGNDAEVEPGHLSVEYGYGFNGIINGDYGYAANPTNESKNIFGITFKNLYFTSNEYSSIKLDFFVPETNKPNTTYHFELGETQRFYKVTWLGGTNYKLGDGTYFVDSATVPEGADEVIAEGGSFNVENARGGEKSIVCYDTDDIEGVSYGDTFYVRTRNSVKVLENSSFGDLVAGWNTIEIPIADNGSYDIDHLVLVSDTALTASYVENIKVSTVKLVKDERFVIKTEADDGISTDGYYYVGGIAQSGWIDANNSEALDGGDYYANPNNARIVTGIYSVDGVWYKFDTDGKLIGKANGLEYAKNGYDKYGNALYAYKMFNEGVIVTDGLIDTGLTEEEAPVYIYTSANGVSLQNNQTVEIEGAVYGFGEDGLGKLLCANADAHVYGEEGIVTKLATCQTAGNKEFTCEVCGSKKQEPMELNPNLHETFDDKGVATCCEGDVKADGVTALYGHSIEIGKDVSIIFYFDITADSEGELEIGRRSAYTSDTTEKIKVSELPDVTVGEKTYKKVTINVSTNAVNSIVIIRYINSEGFVGSEYTYKVQDYIDAVAAHEVNEEFTEEIKAVVSAFDTYAKNVNKVVYGDGNPAPIDDVTPEDFASKHDVMWTVNEKNEQNGYIRLENTYDNIGFEFGEEIKLSVKFSLTGVSSDFKFYVNGKEVKATLLDSGHHSVETKVNASELDKEIVITVAHTGGSELTLNTSALAVAKRMFMSNTSTDAEKNLMKAIQKYSAAVDAYLTPDDSAE